MVFLGIDVSKGRLDCGVLAAEGGKPLGRRSFPNDLTPGRPNGSRPGRHGPPARPRPTRP